MGILSEERIQLDAGHDFAAILQNGTDSTLEWEEEAGHFTTFLGVPQTVLDLAAEKCGYRLASPRDLTGSILEARLDCDWLEQPLYASEGDLQRLQAILVGAQYGYVGNCGYGARLTLQLSDGSTMVLFKATDDCDSLVFGSYGGYFIGDTENQEFWSIFGLDPATKELRN